MAESSSTPEEQRDDIEQPTEAEEFASDLTEDDEDDVDDGAESEDSEDEEDMEEEPKLRYRRVGAGVRDLLEKDTASALRVSDKFVVKQVPGIDISQYINILYVVGNGYTLGSSSCA